MVRVVTIGVLLTMPIVIDEALSQEQDRTDTDDAGMQSCLLVVNRDMTTSNPYIEVITDSDRPFPVVHDIEMHDDTTINITLYLPYTLPTRNHQPFDIGRSPESFHIYVAYEDDTAHYYARSTVEFSSIVLQPITEKNFIRPLPVKSFPDDVVVIQLIGKDDRLRRELSSRLRGIAKETFLQPGYYYGVPWQIRKVRMGIGSFNETAPGQLLVMKSGRPLDSEALSEIGAVMDERELSWYCAPADKR